jgi:hypothetical protein
MTIIDLFPSLGLDFVIDTRSSPFFFSVLYYNNWPVCFRQTMALLHIRTRSAFPFLFTLWLDSGMSKSSRSLSSLSPFPRCSFLLGTVP